MKTIDLLLKAKLISVATLLVSAGLVGNALAQQSARVMQAPAAPAPPAVKAVARPIAPTSPCSAALPPGPPCTGATPAKAVGQPAPPPPPPTANKSSANSKMAVPTTSQNKGKIAPNRTYVPFPTGLTNTLDTKVCTQHAGFAGGLACTAGFPNGMLALVWNCPDCKVDGYRLFNVSGGDPRPIAIPANGGDVTAALFTPSKGDVGCYAVRAYRGSYESASSNTYCTGGGSNGLMLGHTFSPDYVRTSRAIESKMMLRDAKLNYESDTYVIVGAWHQTLKSFDGDQSTNIIARAGVHFNLDTLSQKHIFSAQLHLTVDGTKFNRGSADHSTSCLSAIDVGKEYWWKYKDWIVTEHQKSAFDTTARLEPGSEDGPEAVYDVTPIVADWAAQAADKNRGFVLMTDDQGIDAFTEDGCQTTYSGTPSLEVKYY